DVGAIPSGRLRCSGARTAHEIAPCRLGWCRGWGPGMMAGHGDEIAGGGPARHVPVMLGEVLAALRPSPGAVVVDGTFGAGGYSRAILGMGAQVVAIDRDPDAIAAGRAMEDEFSGRLRLVQ